MARQAVVVGGGAIGISCAHFLQRSGFDTTVVERDRVGRGCSYANCGLIVPSHSQPLPGPGIVREGLRHLIRRDSPFAIRPRPGLAPWLVSFWRACRPEAYRRGSEALVALSPASLSCSRSSTASRSSASDADRWSTPTCRRRGWSELRRRSSCSRRWGSGPVRSP